MQQSTSACLHFHFLCTPLKNLSGDGRPSQSEETCLPNGVTQAGSWSNWLPAQLLFHQAAAQTLLQRALPCTQNARAQRSLLCSKVKSTLRPRLVSTQPAVCALASIFARIVPNTESATGSTNTLLRRCAPALFSALFSQ